MPNDLQAQRRYFEAMEAADVDDDRPAFVLAEIARELDEPAEAQRWRQVARGRCDRKWLSRIWLFIAPSSLLCLVFRKLSLDPAICLAGLASGPVVWAMLRFKQRERAQRAAEALRAQRLRDLDMGNKAYPPAPQ